MKKYFCKKCEEHKPANEMVGNSKSPDGVWCYCKTCHRGTYSRKLKPLFKSTTMRECRMCGEIKPFADFSNKTKKKHSYCVACRKARGLQANLQRYGLTPESYIEMEKAQGGVCAICKEPEREKKRLAIDHDHACCPGMNSCGKCIRGLLCTRCNKGMGVFGDNQELLIKAAEYLKNAAPDT